MALKKEVTFDNGVKISYHRVDEISVDNKNKKLKVSVSSYTNDKYRQKELDDIKNKNKYNELLTLILEENKKIEEDRNVEQVITWSNEANELAFKVKEDTDLSVVKTNFEFDEVEDFSMTNVYNLLKQNDTYIDAEDI